MRSDRGYCLTSPTGRFIAETFRTDERECWAEAFTYLYQNKAWMKPYWKRWDDSIEAAEKRGWTIVEAQVTHS